MPLYLIYDIQTKRVRQRIECVSENLAAASCLEGESYQACDEDCPDSGIILTETGYEADPLTPSVSDLAIAEAKAVRNSILNSVAWTQIPGAPLTTDCIQAYQSYIVQLHRWLVDYPDGQTPFPDQPELVYIPLEDQV